MGLAIQFDNTVVNLDSFAFPSFVWLVRCVIFFATPLLPVVIILRALSLTTEKSKLEAEWMRKQESIYKLYLRHSKLDREKRKVMKALADMKMVEVSTEGVPQLFILIVLTIFSSNSECIGLLEDGEPWTIAFLVLSLLQTFMTIILSTIASINIRKGGQLDVKSQIVLGLSISCQLAAKLWIMVLIALALTEPEEEGTLVDMTSGVLLLVLPIPIGWAATILLHTLLKTGFWLLSTKDKLIHLLSTTWVNVPVRRMEDRDQRHKGKETLCALLLAGLNLVGTSAALAITAALQTDHETDGPGGPYDPGDPDSYYDSYYDPYSPAGPGGPYGLGGPGVAAVLHVMLPSLLFHLAGCGWLLLFEKTVHPWRHLGKEREEGHCCGGKLQGTKRGIEAEPTIWDQVSC